MAESMISTTVGTPSAKHEEHKPLWEKCRDAVAGHDQIRSKTTEYLPKLEGQDDIEGAYTKYLSGALFYNATGRTRQGYKGLIFRKDPDFNLPESMADFERDCTLSGKSLAAYSEMATEEELTVSRFATLVDHPDTEGSQITLAEAEQMGIRPYFAAYTAEDIMGVRTGKVGNRTVIIQARLREFYTQPGEDEFTEDKLEQIRVVELAPPPEIPREQAGDYRGPLFYRQRLFRKRSDLEGKKGKSDKIEWVELHEEERYPKIGGQMIDEVPLFFAGEPEFRTPWMLDLVNVNIHHYQTYADYSAGVKWTTRPQPYVTGQNKEDMEGSYYLGAGELWFFPNDNSDVGMLEYSGDGLQAAEKKLDDLKQDMAVLGARMLVPEKRQAETAEAHAMKREGENSALSSVAGNVSQMLTDALRFAARWQASNPSADVEDISAELNTDYLPAEMSVDDVVKMWGAVQAGGMTIDDYLWNLKQGERLDPTLDEQERRSQLETSPPAGMGQPTLNGGP